MAEIYLSATCSYKSPAQDFQGPVWDWISRRVVETGITPLINTGIAHKEAGIGQIGAGRSVRRWPVRASAGSAGEHGRKLKRRLMKRIRNPLMAKADNRRDIGWLSPARCQGMASLY